MTNEGFDYRERIMPGAGDRTLLDYLAGRYRHSSRREWESRILSGLVRLDGCPARCDEPLRAGMNLLWRRPAWEEPEADGRFSVLFEDDDLLVVDKPAGLPTLPGAGFLRTTLLHRVRDAYPAASPLHRLGRWTSGAVLFARTRRAAADLSRQWADREVGKRYRALAVGDPSWDETTVDVAIGPVTHPLLGTVHAATPGGKAASSRITVLQRRGEEFLCEVRIATGRPHQIRIHLAAAGHPLVGDPLYGPGGIPRPATTALPGDAGYLLHSLELAFRHPRTGVEMTVIAPPPAALCWP